jgi:chromosome segregation ATPase
MNNLESRISSLEKMLQYLDEFIHLKEEEKESTSQNNLIINQLNIKINLLEKEITKLHKEKTENIKTIEELNNKIINLERQINNYNYNNMQDIIFSLSNKEKKLNMLINDFHDMAKNTDLIINNKLNEKINEFNIFNENRISEILGLIQNINKVIELNDCKMTKFNENIQNMQKDNLNMIKMITIQEQKFNSFDLINNEINSIKEKIHILIEDYNTKLENSFN